jgi:hypothetical protein
VAAGVGQPRADQRGHRPLHLLRDANIDGQVTGDDYTVIDAI